ncbi:MAG: tRNA uridine(34) 5-carboxymethylaminomethyl modification radical SAM/GNAT enzyme Elp3 [Patescibacteria group bacterium]|nr:tRNA uridine(34) 5-carboxymethylaminomethyl modification radical SAM/GNAT enzyme Elp3 [Patescibacteria group bacterium]
MIYYPPTFPKEKEEILKKLFLYLIDKNIKSKKEINFFIREFLVNEKIKDFFPKIWHLNFIYKRFFEEKIKEKKPLLSFLKVVSIRSLSGIVPLSVFTSPKNSCPFACVYCALVEGAPKSYFPDEAAVMRAIRSDYDPFNQTFDRLIQFYLSGHHIDKVELIIQGGTFSFYDKKYRQYFVKRIFDALNTDIEKIIKTGELIFDNSKNLEEAKKKNEKAKSRMVGLTIETRPDYIDNKEVLFLRKLGVTRVELGVQSTDDEILKIVNRGHKVESVVLATKILKDAGFKITYHLMPGLPGSNFDKDIKVLKEVFQDDRFKPDNIKFYPTQVVKNSPLANWYQVGKFKPIDEKYLWHLTEKFKKEIVPSWVRINRLVRDLTRNDLVVETFPSNFRQNLEKYLKEKNIKCPCIRCREIRSQKIKGEIKIKTILYSASFGKEFFIEAVDEDYKLLGYLRLRIPSFVLKEEKFFIKSLNDCAIIRELHVLGELTPLSQKKQVQHQGFGKKLINEAIKITKNFNLKKIAVISAVGTREYYKKLGFEYEKEGEYMIKKL